MDRIGVLLLNLGGPEKIQDVRPFLYNLFSDPEIIRLPFPIFQKPLAWLIASSRRKKSEENYRLIGGGSPLRRITEEQGQCLQSLLEESGQPSKIYIGMRYWHPFTEEAIAQIKTDGISHVVILPLYPQFSISTSGSSFRILEEMWKKDPDLAGINYTLIPSWYDNPGYLSAITGLIKSELANFENPELVHIFFSAHGVPQSYVEEAGDPYQQEIEHCTKLIMENLNLPNAYNLAYQSKVGPVDWLKPYTEDAIKELGEQGIKDLLIIPISFVSEHIETLEEIDIEYREVAHVAGISNFRRMPALNSDPDFIQALAGIVTDSLQKPPCTFAQVIHPKKNMKMYPQEPNTWGLTTTAEVWNGRLAMLGFIGLLVELISGKGFLHYLRLLH